MNRPALPQGAELNEAIHRFKALLADTPDIWRSFDIRALAFSHGGVQSNLLCTVSLSWLGTRDLYTFDNLPGSGPLVCHQVVLPIEHLSVVLEQLQAGVIEFGSTDVMFEGNDSSNPPKATAYSWTYVYRAQKLKRPIGVDMFDVGHTLMARGSNSSNLFSAASQSLDEFDNTLRRLTHPWDGADSITKLFLRTNQRFPSHEPTAIEFFAPIPARLSGAETTLANGLLTIVVRAMPSVQPLLRIGYFAIDTQSHVRSGSMTVGKGDWTRGNDVNTWRGKIELPGVRRASVFLSTPTSNIDRVEVVDLSGKHRSPRLVGHSSMDPDFRLLQSQLNQEDTADSRAFERAIARVFTFAGFACEAYGSDRKLTNGPDALIYTADNSTVLVMECTVGTLGSQKGKLSQLVARANRLREMMGEDSPVTVQPVIVSALPRSRLPSAEMTAAGADGVAVLAKEEIAELFETVLESISPEEILRYCNSKIPSRQETHLEGYFSG